MMPEILIDTDDKLPDYINLKNAVISVTCFNKVGAKCHPQKCLEEALYNE